ncbi:MAG: histidine--tRNA ligase [Planctomycetes bacterium]|nr:histidine--tRNA ligase [Planctomycetota bacterium]
MAKLQAPSGFRDFLPDAQRKRNELIRRIRAVYESFGYEPMETPCMENLDVFLGKGGGENEKLMYRILKRGASLERALESKDELADLAMRFDLTVPLARYYATHRGELPAVFKRYQIGPVWRAERPQHGRFREFVQCDIDVLGSTSMAVEADVILTVATALADLGFSGLTVRLNSRPLLRVLCEKSNVPKEAIDRYIILLDKIDKQPWDELNSDMLALGCQQSELDWFKGLYDYVKESKEYDPRELFKEIGAKVGDKGNPYVAQIQEVLELTPPLPSGKLVFDPFLARGMDYYTGPIFEVAAEGVPFSLAGGGRFDELIGKLGGQPTPACGFSIGFERVYTLMDERNMFAGATGAADALVVVPDAAGRAEALNLGAELRSAGLRIDVYPGEAKAVKQYELAERKGIPFAVQAGPEAGKVTLRDLKTRKNEILARAGAAAWLKGKA